MNYIRYNVKHIQKKGGKNVLSIVKMRKKCALTQTDVAFAVGVNRSTVAKWETGKAYPRIETLQRLAALFHCNMEDLLEIKNPSD